MSLEQTLVNLNQRKTRLVSEIEQLSLDFGESVPDEVLQFANLLDDLTFKLDNKILEDEESALQNLYGKLNDLSSAIRSNFVKQRKSYEDFKLGENEEFETDYSKIRELNRKIAFCEIVLGKLKLESAPQIVNIDPSLKCNYRCRTCHHAMSQKNKNATLSESVLAKLDDFFMLLDGLHVFGGGEPTLSYTLYALAEKIKQYNVHAEILTNGSTLSKMKLPLSYFKRLGISFDGDNERTFQAIRYGSHFYRLIERIKKFRAEFPSIEIYLNMTLNKVNVDEIEGVVKLAADLGINTVQLNIMHPYYAHIIDIELDQNDKKLLELQLDKARKIGAENGVRLVVSLDLDALPLGKHNKTKEELLLGLEGYAVALDDHVLSVNEAVDEARKALLSVSSMFKISKEVISPNHNREFFKSDIVSLEETLLALEAEVKCVEESELSLPTCLVPWVRANIRTDGTVRPCAIMNDTMGCVESEKGLKAVWNSDKYVELRSSHVPAMNKEPCETCKKCTYVERGIRKDEVLGYFREIKNK